MMLLFDIDGTLVSAGGAGRTAMARAFERVLGVSGAMDGVRLNGSTDPLILESAYEAHVGRAPKGAKELETIMEAYFELLEDELERKAEVFRVLPGVEAILKATRAAGYLLGLATGNAERGARIKLERGALNRYFSFGGFGSDAAERAELVRRGIERGQAQAERQGGPYAPEEIAVLGDTERDIEAGRAAGAVTIGVLSGSMHHEELAAAKPDLLVESMEDRRLWDFLRL